MGDGKIDGSPRRLSENLALRGTTLPPLRRPDKRLVEGRLETRRGTRTPKRNPIAQASGRFRSGVQSHARGGQEERVVSWGLPTEVGVRGADEENRR